MTTDHPLDQPDPRAQPPARLQLEAGGDLAVGRDVVGRDQISVTQTLLQLNIHPHFAAAPAPLRRTFDALMRDKLTGFVGRQFVLDAVDQFLRRETSGYLIIRGVPGIGKSSFLAKLVNDRGYPHHFNVASQNIRSPQAFLQNICAQLKARYGLTDAEPSASAWEDSGFLMQCLEEAAATTAHHPIVIAVDSLDEADRLGLAPSVNTLFLPASLPAGVYVIATTRPLADLQLQAAPLQTLDLDADSAGNLADIETYLAARLEQPPLRARLTAWGVTDQQFRLALRRKSQGNFMYLRHVLPAIEDGRFVQGGLDELPEGLLAYYQRHWRQMRAGHEAEFTSTWEPIICTLAVAQEPVTVDQIAAWTRVAPGRVRQALQGWREFLEQEVVENQSCYRLYHASFQDFLKQQVDLTRFDDLIADYYLALGDPAGWTAGSAPNDPEHAQR